MKQQLVETLEKQIAEMKERLLQAENGRHSAFEKQLEHFEQQRQELNAKIEKLHHENIDKDRQIGQLQNRVERLLEDIEHRKGEMEGAKGAAEKEKR